jgi:hypothetical protein
MQDTSKRDNPEIGPARRESSQTRRIDPFALAELLKEWMHGDEAEQRETFEDLRRALDEDRPPGYKLFS